MALRTNGNMFCSVGVQHFGVSAVASAFPHVLQNNFMQTNRIRNLTAGESGISTFVGYPSGYLNPASWMLPQKSGAIAARNTVVGTSSVSGSMQSGYNIEAAITGEGGVPNTVNIGLIISIVAAVTGSGGISSATTEALTSLVAALTGSGDATATAQGLADLTAAMTGAGVINATNSALMNIESTIRGYSDLTPEGIRDNVWGAIASNYNISGTMGNKLNSAASGGVDLNALAQAVWEYVDRTLTAGGTGATPEEIADAILLAAQVTPIHADIQKVRSQALQGVGTTVSPWNPV